MLESDRLAVRAYEEHLLATEGPYHVDGCFYRDCRDAERQRRWSAERMVREARRHTDYAARQSAAARLPERPRVGTCITPRERMRVDAATGAQLALTHRDTLHALRGDLAAGIIDAVLVSAATVTTADVPALAAMLRDFPGAALVGLILDSDDSRAIPAALQFGRAGAAAVIDVRAPSGWAALRATFDAHRAPTAFGRHAVASLVTMPSGATASPGWCRFLAATFALQPYTSTTVASELGVMASTLNSRFFRAALPSPKRYLVTARLVWAAHLAETPGLSIAAIAMRLDASSPQSFGRTVRTCTGMTAATFLASVDGETMLERYRVALIDPYARRLDGFDPLAAQRAPHRAHGTPNGRTVAPSTGRAA